jgi:DNA-cytosine methyltransferase
MKKEKVMNVLSLFDGMSCGRLALDRVGIEYDKYYASEIDKHAIKVATHNYPDTIELGDINKWKEWSIDWSHVDLILAGSPCQGFSIAGKQLAFDDPRSKLFFVFVDILNHVKSLNPEVKFLLENVVMKQEYQDVITQQLGVEPVLINSALVSAQNRKRLYWANWHFEQPQDKGILLKDIVHEGEKTETILSEYIVPFDRTLQILDKEVQRGKVGYFRKDSQSSRVYYIHDKAITLTGEGGGGAAKMGQYLFGCITPDRVEKRQNGQRFNEGKKFYTLTAQDKHGVLIEGYIRKLTPVECERLQTVPDNYTAAMSNTQRYRMLGNGWTVDVIAHIFKGLTETGQG